MRAFAESLQPLGRALMLPIAVLPAAGLLLRLGQPDLLNISFIAAAGDAIFANLGLLFAIGVAVGLAKENHGAAGLAGAVCFLVATKAAAALMSVPPQALAQYGAPAHDLAAAAFKEQALAKLSVPTGIASGLIAGWLYNRYRDIRLPEYLAFFGGRRFVPIASGVAGLVLGAVLGLTWTDVSGGIDTASHAVIGAGPVGLFIYGVLNRLLIVTGLHHILNNIAWFIVGDYHGVTGDLKRFFAGDPTAGRFMSGFFPVMMFGLPAACLAMYRSAKPERRKAVGGALLSMALTAFLTGVTEPIEFSFMFLAPMLYAIHALLTGIAMVVMDMLGVKLGFGFSAGLFDYVINFGKATRPWLLLPVGAVYFALYYGLFRFAIRTFDLKTLGREDEGEAVADAAVAQGARGARFVAALGGAGNLVSVDACTTRLRLIVDDPSKVDETQLKALCSRGVVRPSAKALQVVLGPMADQIAGEIRDAMAAGDAGPARHDIDDADALLAAFGGRGNVRAVAPGGSRLRVAVSDPAIVDETRLNELGARGIVRPKPENVHVLVGPQAAALAGRLRALLAG
ncbi:MAG TPA: N-acetylglucosamine-specific PTS transporter subunit IIBC [Rhizomicrobium sp.]|nr:N-acetylglucosamine-specific PTS transporter subunit IIBC [Rhizomicrobium sp.]